MLPQSLFSFRSFLLIVGGLILLCLFGPLALAQDLNLEGLASLEAPRVNQNPGFVNQAAAPLDLSGLDRLADPLSAAHGLQLSGLQELEPLPRKATPAAQLVLPAATRPPAAVPATTAPAGVVCVNGQCYRTSPPMRQRGRLFRIR